jgi:hypothetical protein
LRSKRNGASCPWGGGWWPCGLRWGPRTARRPVGRPRGSSTPGLPQVCSGVPRPEAFAGGHSAAPWGQSIEDPAPRALVVGFSRALDARGPWQAGCPWGPEEWGLHRIALPRRPVLATGFRVLLLAIPGLSGGSLFHAARALECWAPTQFTHSPRTGPSTPRLAGPTRGTRSRAT